MINEVFLPALGETMTEATIVRWVKKVGDTVNKGDVLFEIETDKATLEVEALSSGLLRKIVVAEGSVVPVGKVVAYLADNLTDPLDLEEPKPVAEVVTQTAGPETNRHKPIDGDRIIRKKPAFSPRARRLADRLGIDISCLAGMGTGGGGRVIERDVQRYADELALAQSQSEVVTKPAPEPSVVVPTVEPVKQPEPGVQDGDQFVPLVGMRKAIAENLTFSVQNAPHIYLSLDIDMTSAEEWRKGVNEERKVAGLRNISATALILKAAAWSLARHPYLNAYYKDNGILLKKAINVGVAVSLENGLIVPVVKDVPSKGLSQIADEISQLTTNAREGRLKADQLSGGSFTVSNLGMFGVDWFTAIINPPQAGILAVGRIAERYVSIGGGQFGPRSIMTVTLSADHRIVDGAEAAGFLSDLKNCLEDISRMLI